MLKEQTIVITGTSRGIGREMVSLFSEHGANVIAHARKHTTAHEKWCEEIAGKTGQIIFPVYFDITDADAMKNGVGVIRKSGLRVTGLVNNAGMIHSAFFQMTSMEDLRAQFEVNFFGPFLFTQYILKLMLRGKRGSIVSLSSAVALDGNAGRSAYGASKAALLTMTQCIAEEAGALGIRANVLCPGVIETDMTAEMKEEILEDQLKVTSLKRKGLPRDVAHAAMFLLSDDAAYITGQVLRVDGGVSAHIK